MDKLERLLNLISALLETSRPLTAEELRVRVPGYPEAKASFRRTFERDKDDLREMGVPLVYELIPGVDPATEGYRIDRARYYLRDPGFEPDELAALHLAATTVRVDGVDGADALWRLGGIVEPDGSPPTAVDAQTHLPADPHLPDLYRACAERRTAQFAYRNQARTVDAHRVGYQRGHWYLTGLDHGHQEERNFRLDRIEGEVTLGPRNSFAAGDRDRSVLPEEPWLLGEGTEVVARLLVDVDQAAWAGRQLGEGVTSEPAPDGGVIFSVAVTNWPAFRSFVLSFLDHAEILDPPDLRQAMVEWLGELAR